MGRSIKKGPFVDQHLMDKIVKAKETKSKAPIKAIVYGYPVKGMKPAIERTRPEPLQPNVPYVLFVEAGKVKGQTNFFTKEVVSAP